MTARKLLPRVLVVLAVLLAVYEAVAIFTDWVPTITDIVQSLPGVAEVLVIGPVIVWLMWHFGWLHRGDKPPYGHVEDKAETERWERDKGWRGGYTPGPPPALEDLPKPRDPGPADGPTGCTCGRQQTPGHWSHDPSCALIRELLLKADRESRAQDRIR